MNIKTFILFASVGLIWGGTQTLYTTVSNLEPSVHTLEDFEKSPSTKKWLSIQGGHIDLTEAATTSSFTGGPIKQVSLPLRLVDAKSGDPFTILFATSNPDIIKTVDEMSRLSTQDQMIAYMLKNRHLIRFQKDIQGLVRSGFELDSKDESKLKELFPEMKKDFVLIDDQAKPDWVKVMMLPMGLALAWCFVMIGHEKRKTPPPPPQPPPTPEL